MRASTRIPAVAAALTLVVAAIPAMAAAQVRSDTTVRTVGAPRNRGIATLVSEMQIGGAAATADEYIFAYVAEVRPLRDGSIVVVDRGSGASVFVRVYDASGKYIRTLGRYGEGPGEYRIPNGVAELPDGRILVRDARGGRIAVHPASGSPTQFFPSQSSTSTSIGPDFITVTPTGAIILRSTIRAAGRPTPPARTGYIRLRSDGSAIDTIFAPELPEVAGTRLAATRTTADGSSTSSHGTPFAPMRVTSLSPLGYFVTSNTSTYAIDLLLPNAGSSSNAMWRPGDPLVSLRRAAVPTVPVGETERAARKKYIEDDLRTLDPQWQWTGPEVPRVKPPTQGLYFGLDGRIWVRLSTPSETFDPEKEPARQAPSLSGRAGTGGAGGAAPVTMARPQLTWREPLLFDVLDPDGTYFGQVAIPYGTNILARRGDHAWGVTRDSDGVETLHRFRIVWR